MSRESNATLNRGYYVLIPCYNHGATLAGVVEAIQRLTLPAGIDAKTLPILIVNDGSNEATTREIDRLAAETPSVTALHLAVNSGKGEAVLAGLAWGREAGLTHALQVDADGQHEITKLADLISASLAEPEALVSGRPVYDASVPKGRLIGRYVTHVWVWIETWSLAIQDSLCGFRVYPVERTLAAAAPDRFFLLGKLGRRMDFDIEIMVRYYWADGVVRFVPTAVVYPEGGISHFNVWRDNLRISAMHTRLCIASFFAMPSRVWRQVTGKTNHRSEAPTTSSASNHWATMKERRALVGILGFEILYGLYRLGGRAFFNAVLFPVMLVFWLTGRRQRQAIEHFLSRVQWARSQEGRGTTTVTSFDVFQTFGHSILDRLLAWRGELSLGTGVTFADERSRQTLVPSQPGERGKLLFVSHLGVAEACRAIAALDRHQVVNVLMFEAHAQHFKRMMAKWAPDSQTAIWAVNDLGPDTLDALEAALNRGEWIAIAADRLPVTEGREAGEHTTVTVPFLGAPARFPIGPYVLAECLKAAVVTLFAVRTGDTITIHSAPFADKIEREAVPGMSRREARRRHYRAWAQRYAAVLGQMAVAHPQNWFNFYDVWAGVMESERVVNDTPAMRSRTSATHGEDSPHDD